MKWTWVMAWLVAVAPLQAAEPAAQTAPPSREGLVDVPPLKDGDVILLLGDSITEHGNRPGGYVDLLERAMGERLPGKDIKIVPAGVGGDRIRDLRNRFDRDVPWHQPTIIVLEIGINDFTESGYEDSPTKRQLFELGLKDLIWRSRRIGARPVLVTHTLVGEQKPGTNRYDKMLDEYSELIRQLGKAERCQVIELRKPFVEYVASHNPKNAYEGCLTVDGAHLNDLGNRLMAERILEAFGVPAPAGDGAAKESDAR